MWLEIILSGGFDDKQTNHETKPEMNLDINFLKAYNPTCI